MLQLLPEKTAIKNTDSVNSPDGLANNTVPLTLTPMVFRHKESSFQRLAQTETRCPMVGKSDEAAEIVKIPAVKCWCKNNVFGLYFSD